MEHKKLIEKMEYNRKKHKKNKEFLHIRLKQLESELDNIIDKNKLIQEELSSK